MQVPFRDRTRSAATFLRDLRTFDYCKFTYSSSSSSSPLAFLFFSCVLLKEIRNGMPHTKKLVPGPWCQPGEAQGNAQARKNRPHADPCPGIRPTRRHLQRSILLLTPRAVRVRRYPDETSKVDITTGTQMRHYYKVQKQGQLSALHVPRMRHPYRPRLHPHTPLPSLHPDPVLPIFPLAPVGITEILFFSSISGRGLSTLKFPTTADVF